MAIATRRVVIMVGEVEVTFSNNEWQSEDPQLVHYLNAFYRPEMVQRAEEAEGGTYVPDVLALMAIRAAEALGGRVIRAVRAYDDQLMGAGADPNDLPVDAVQKLRRHPTDHYDKDVLDALERVAQRTTRSAALEPAYR